MLQTLIQHVNVKYVAPEDDDEEGDETRFHYTDLHICEWIRVMDIQKDQHIKAIPYPRGIELL